jgi:hypothetical protein
MSLVEEGCAIKEVKEHLSFSGHKMGRKGRGRKRKQERREQEKKYAHMNLPIFSTLASTL